MAFHVPSEDDGLYDQVVSRFRMLLRRQVITGISSVQLNQWLSNFVGEQEKYLAARVLENLSYRSNAMVTSAIEHVCECVLPCELKRKDIGHFASVDAFVDSLRAGGADHPVRFVAVDGMYDKTPGKSGAVVIREFQRQGHVAKALTCKPESLAELPVAVKCLVFVDDMLGTGTQFSGFAKHYNLAKYAQRLTVVYCPLVAHQTGLDALAKDFPWLTVLPVEVFGEEHQFYRGMSKKPEVWAIDEANSVADVRAFVTALCKARKISPGTKHSLDLLLGFEHATPNNSLPLLYAESSDWNHLLIRQK